MRDLHGSVFTLQRTHSVAACDPRGPHYRAAADDDDDHDDHDDGAVVCPTSPTLVAVHRQLIGFRPFVCPRYVELMNIDQVKQACSLNGQPFRYPKGTVAAQIQVTSTSDTSDKTLVYLSGLRHDIIQHDLQIVLECFGKVQSGLFPRAHVCRLVAPAGSVRTWPSKACSLSLSLSAQPARSVQCCQAAPTPHASKLPRWRCVTCSECMVALPAIPLPPSCPTSVRAAGGEDQDA